MPRHYDATHHKSLPAHHKSLPTISEDTLGRPRRGDIDGGQKTDLDGNTALHRYAKAGDVARAELVLLGQNHVAKTHVSRAEILLSHNHVANVSPVHVRNNKGSTPLHVAAYYGKEEMVGILLEGGAKEFQKNKAGWHAGHYANRCSQPLNKRLTVGCKPNNPANTSHRFCFKSVRDLYDPAKTKEKRISNLKSDSGISIWNSKEYLPTWNSKECL